jgi:hypothetical protein
LVFELGHGDRRVGKGYVLLVGLRFTTREHHLDITCEIVLTLWDWELSALITICGPLVYWNLTYFVNWIYITEYILVKTI